MKLTKPCLDCKGTKTLRKYHCRCNDDFLFRGEDEDHHPCAGCPDMHTGDAGEAVIVSCRSCSGTGEHIVDTRMRIHRKLMGTRCGTSSSGLVYIDWVLNVVDNAAPEIINTDIEF